MNFDPKAFADDMVELQRRARYMPLVYAVCGLLLGMSFGEIAGMFDLRGTINGSEALVPPLALTGVVLGFFIGRSRALVARLQTQLRFRQLEGKSVGRASPRSQRRHSPPRRATGAGTWHPERRPH